MSLSNVNKEVATRLFGMLAMNEQAVGTIKRDHSAYAKLSLLSQQMNLLKGQAQQVVAKSAAVSEASVVENKDCCTTLSNEYTEGAGRLLDIMAVSDTTISLIKSDQTACAKLSLLSEQVGLIQQQAQQVVEECDLNSRLQKIAAGWACKLVPGTMYYHYTQHGKEVLSRIADHEWSNYEIFHGKFIYDYDFTFRQIFGDMTADEMNFGSSFTMPTLLPSICHSLPQPDPPAAETKCSGTDSMMDQPLKPICPVLSRW